MYQQNYNISKTPNYTHIYTNTKDRSFKNNPLTFVIMGIILMIIGIFTTIVQVSETTSYYALEKDGKSTQAIVTDVDKRTNRVRSRHRTSTGRRTTTKRTYYYVTGTYTVDNENYTLSFRSNSYYNRGDKINVFYEEGDPSNSVREGDNGVGELVIGVAIIIAGGAMSGVGIKKLRDEKDLKAMGLL